MKVLIDTNIILDVLLVRDQFFDKSDEAIRICTKKGIECSLAAHTITNIYYLTRKNFTNDEERREVILNLFKTFKVIKIDSKKLVAALKNTEIKDFEDCLQVECAKSIKADYIITRDAKDFTNSEITFLTPEEFCSKFEENSNDISGVFL